MDMDTVRQELLMAYAAGRLPEPMALAVATHVALNRRARGILSGFEEIGGSFFDELEAEPLAADSLDAVMARLDEPEAPRVGPLNRGWNIPAVLAKQLPAPVEKLQWRWLGPMAEYPLPDMVPGYKAKLFRLRAGWKTPQHTHDGNEITVCLRGAFSDSTGRYKEGDMAIADASIDHQPHADPSQDCLCLAVTDARVRLTGTFTRLLNPFVRSFTG